LTMSGFIRSTHEVPLNHALPSGSTWQT
jgi:hypothetical protein